MEIVKTSIHKINHAANEVAISNITPDNQDLTDYLNELLEKIANIDSRRKFQFSSDATEVLTRIGRILKDEEFEKETFAIADRLMRKEQNAQSDISHLKHDIQKGVLFQIVFKQDDQYRLIISKADHAAYLDETDLKRRQGLPEKKKTYKAFLVEFDDELAIERLFVYDTNANIARYWWSDFLELKEYNTNETNTDTAFDAITRRVLSKIKEKFPSDHNILKNRIIGYFRSNEGFEIDSFIENAIGNYDPVDPNFKVKDFKKRLKELPEKEDFDSQFTIAPEVIKARKVRTIVPLNDKLDLYIKEYVPELNQVIKPYESGGVKYIQIRTDSGYEAFKQKTDAK